MSAAIRLKYPNNIDKNKLLGKFKFNYNNNTTFSLASSSCFGYWEDTDWWYNPDGDACNCSGDEYYAYTESTYVSICFDDGGSGGGYGGGPIGDGGGGGFTPPDPFAGKELAPSDYYIDHYWEDPAYDNNSYTFPPCTDKWSCFYDQDGYRKNGNPYNYKDGTIQNYTNDNGENYAIFTKTNGDKVNFPGATITDSYTLAGRGATTSGGGIHASLSFYLSDLQHEYGHYLQAKKYGSKLYNEKIVPASLWNAAVDTKQGHRNFWTEVDANRLAIAFFGSNSDIALDTTNYPR